ncbi:MAG TPA: 4Fe-4S dicluster domain-containing protein [Planctomycetota bacterium]|nr:4Fe-4S dicluster domain-containing protein [Planctomycetota bacterium]
MSPVSEESSAQGKGRRGLRLGLRIGALAAAVALLVPLVPWPSASVVVPSLSPFVAASGALAARAVSTAALIALPVLVMAILRGRWFCRWLCPVGLLAEQAGRVGLGRASWTARVPRVGRGIVLLTLGGACLGYPLLLWLDPLAFFSGAFGVLHKPLAVGGTASAALLGGVIALGLILPGAWCGRLCPLGATQELLAAWKGLFRRPELPGEGGRPVVRRAWLRLAPGALLAAAGAGLALLVRRVALGRSDPPIRPPGALDEGRFAGVCVRCGNCLRACPTRILRPDLAPGHPEGWLAPVVVFEDDYCREDCTACSQVCPSGAIAHLSPKAKRRVAMGMARVELEFCFLSNDHECQICRRHCPFDAIAYAWDEAAYSRTPVVDADRCTGCGACEVACPCTSGEGPTPRRKAIRVVPRRAVLAAPHA